MTVLVAQGEMAEVASAVSNKSSPRSVPDYQLFCQDRPDKRTFRVDVYVHDACPASARSVPDAVLKPFIDVCNEAFGNREHVYNFGPDKLRYPTTDILRQDLNTGLGGWVFLLHEQDDLQHWTPVSCAKVTLGGKGMDGGVGIHQVLVKEHDQSVFHTPEDRTVYWLGALGSIRAAAGTELIRQIKHFLSSHVSIDRSFSLKAYSVHSWGIQDKFALPASSPLISWFVKQDFTPSRYSWKPPGTWGSFYGACLVDLEYIHPALSHT